MHFKCVKAYFFSPFQNGIVYRNSEKQGSIFVGSIAYSYNKHHSCGQQLAPFFFMTNLRYLFFFIGTSSCLEENTDFNGNDIIPLTQRFTNSWQECGNYFLK